MCEVKQRIQAIDFVRFSLHRMISVMMSTLAFLNNIYKTWIRLLKQSTNFTCRTHLAM